MALQEGTGRGKQSGGSRKRGGIPRILVTGDVVVDNHLYVGARPAPYSPGRGSQLERVWGGAKLVESILRSIASRRPRSRPFEVEFGLTLDPCPGVPGSKSNAGGPDHHSELHCYAEWRAQPKDHGADSDQVWRVSNAFGYGSGEDLPLSFPGKVKENLKSPSVIVLDDAALGFRFCAPACAWPVQLGKKGGVPPWIVLKTSHPICQGDLWQTLVKEFRERLVVVVAVNDIRREEVNVSKGISWERSAADLVWELTNNPALRDLLNCRHLIIPFMSEGALWVENGGSEGALSKWWLILDPEHMEDEWRGKNMGRVFGQMSCLTASVAAHLARLKAGVGEKALHNALLSSVQQGLAAMRKLQSEGHGKVEAGVPGFPSSAVAETILRKSATFRSVPVPEPSVLSEDGSVLIPVGGDPRETWSILATYPIPARKGAAPHEPLPLYGIARRALLFGLDELLGMPHARFGKMITADRSEIEALRAIHRLIEGYCRNSAENRPLSIGVFGPPGAGKSFAVKELSRQILGEHVPMLEFNLSQFEDARELEGAFHQIRDQVLKGCMPVVFWDEFDSRDLYWLQFLLAPMQDGHFQEGQMTHPIGRCIFVFAGATRWTMQDFDMADPALSDGAADETEIKAYSLFKAAKGPDFVSRLGAYLNVLGPNQRRVRDEDGHWVTDPSDVCFPIRRALMIRSNMGLSRGQELDMDRGLATAMLEVGEYKRGARSLSRIVAALQGESVSHRRLNRSQVPPAEVLNMHVDAPKFLALANRATSFKQKARDLAPEVHRFWRELAHKEGWKLDFDVDFENLPPHIKKDNEAAAARAFDILELVGIWAEPESTLPPGHPTVSLQDAKQVLRANREFLAEREHIGWMDQKLRSGYRKTDALDKNEDSREHPALVPYDFLRAKDKKKDRGNVLHIPDIIHQADYVMVWR